MTWVKLCQTDDIDEGDMRAFEIRDVRIALYNVDGNYYATNNVCTHAFALLTDGWLDDAVIECPLHSALFDVRTGEVLSGPAECALKTYTVRALESSVEILID